jgi:hypothetical protein
VNTIVVNGQEYEFSVEREPVIAFALHHTKSTAGEISLRDVRPIFEYSGCSPKDDFKNEEGDTNHLAFVPGQGASYVTATVKNLKTQQQREFTLGLSMEGSGIAPEDVRAMIKAEIESIQRAAARRAVQS